MRNETRKQRIQRERAALGLKPWQFAPSEIDDGPNPYAPYKVGWASWHEAQAQRRELRERSPGYFAGTSSKRSEP